MATGDDALTAGMDIVDGNSVQANTIDELINQTRDYLANAVMLPGAVTTADLADGAVKVEKMETFTDPDLGKNKIMRLNSAGQLACNDPTATLHTANKRYVDGKIAAIPTPNLSSRVAKTGDVMTGNLGMDGSHIFIPASTAATESYTVAYVNGDGRLSRGASSERYKKFISEIDPATLGDIWPNLVRYQMRAGDGSWKYGYIAERLAEHPDQEPFVVYSEFDGDQLPESIDFIALLMAQNAQLHQAVELLAQRIDTLETP